MKPDTDTDLALIRNVRKQRRERLEKNRRSTLPATLAQGTKILNLIMEQEPTVSRLQNTMRFIPDLLKTDMGAVNRFDFCRMIGRELPFKVVSSEIEMEVDYDKPFLPQLTALDHQGCRCGAEGLLTYTGCIPKGGGKITHKFFIIEVEGRVGVTSDGLNFESFDLNVADLSEFVSFIPHIPESLGDYKHRLWRLYGESFECKLDEKNHKGASLQATLKNQESSGWGSRYCYHFLVRRS